MLLNLGNDHSYALDDVGTRMWQLLVETGEPETVVRRGLALDPGMLLRPETRHRLRRFDQSSSAAVG